MFCIVKHKDSLSVRYNTKANLIAVMPVLILALAIFILLLIFVDVAFMKLLFGVISIIILLFIVMVIVFTLNFELLIDEHGVLYKKAFTCGAALSALFDESFLFYIRFKKHSFSCE